MLILLVVGYRLIILILTGIACYISRKRDKNNCFIPAKLRNRYIFLFPVFREQAIIKETFQYYERFLCWFPQIEILFIVTKKEEDVPSTKGILSDLIIKSVFQNHIECIECLDLKGTKATQVNFALDYIRSKYKKIPYILSFDCDARISWQDFFMADQYISQHSEHVLYSFLPRPSIDQIKNFFIQASMLHHVERMLALEYPSSLALGLNYPMGAASIYSPKLWRYIVYIPEPIDDLSLKYILNYYRQSYVALPFFVSVQAPPNVRNLYRQIIPIFSGVFSYFHTMKQNNLVLSIRNILTGLGWYVLYVLEYASICFLIITILCGNMLFLSLFICQVILDLYFVERLSVGNIFLHLFGYVIRFSQFIYFLFKKFFWMTDLCQFKTDRDVSKTKEKCVTIT